MLRLSLFVLSKAMINTEVNSSRLKNPQTRQVAVDNRTVTAYTVLPRTATLIAFRRSCECGGVAVVYQIRVSEAAGKTLGGATKTGAAIYCRTLLLPREYTGQPTTAWRPCTMELSYL